VFSKLLLPLAAAPLTNRPPLNLTTARASKAALNIMTKTMAIDFARDGKQIECVLVHPGACWMDGFVVEVGRV